MGSRSGLPAGLTAAAQDFYLELRRLVHAAGLSYRQLEGITGPFSSKSAWERWINGKSRPPRNMVRKLAEDLERDELSARHLVDLWDQAFAPGRGVRVQPAQLPPPALRFTGRTSELATLAAMAEPAIAGTGRVVIVVEGTAGVGKTTLVNHFAASIAREFPDGQLYANMRGFDQAGHPATGREALHSFLNALSIPVPASGSELAVRYRSALAGRRILVVVDNASDADQVRNLIPGGVGCLVLVTSRRELTALAAEGADVLSLDPFTRDEARDLLTDRLGTERVTREHAAADELIALCARLPLALSVVAARAAKHPGFPLAALATEFSSRGLDALDTGDPATNVRSVFFWSYKQLSGTAGRMFRQLGVHPGRDITLDAAVSLTAMIARHAQLALDELAGAHLLDEHRPGRYAMHDLLRVYAGEKAAETETEAERHAALGRVLDYYLGRVLAAELRYFPVGATQRHVRVHGGNPFADPGQAANWVKTERPNLAAAITTGVRTHPALALQIVDGFGKFLWEWRYLDELIAICEYTLNAARMLRDRPAELHLLRSLGNACELSGQRAAALTAGRDCVAIARELAAGDPDRYEPSLGRDLANLANRLAASAQERLAAAAEAVAIGRRATGRDRPDWLAGALDNLAVVLTETGRPAEAEPAARESVNLWRKLVDVAPWQYERYLANTLITLAAAGAGRTGEAIAAAAESVGIYRRIAYEDLSPYGAEVAGRLGKLSEIVAATGRTDEAATVAQEIALMRARLEVSPRFVLQAGYPLGPAMLAKPSEHDNI